MSLNSCSFIGHVGKTPEARKTKAGESVVSFSIAVSERWSDKTTGEKKESTTWVPVVAWGHNADTASKYLHKGSHVYITGKFSVRKWQDKENNTRYSTEIILPQFGGQIVLLDSKPKDAGEDSWDDELSLEAPF